MDADQSSSTYDRYDDTIMSVIRMNTNECDRAIDETIMDVINLAFKKDDNKSGKCHKRSKTIDCIEGPNYTFHSQLFETCYDETIISVRQSNLIDEQNIRKRRLISIDRFDCSLFSVGNCDVVCSGCGGKHFRGEITKTANKLKNSFSKCCNFGDLSNLSTTIFDYPNELQKLFEPDNKFHDVFINNIRRLNASFSVASLQSIKKIPDINRPGRFVDTKGEINFNSGVPIYKIQGTIYHRLNQIAEPNQIEEATNGQLFYVETNESLEIRKKNLSDKSKRCDENNQSLFDALVDYVDKIINKTYAYANSYKMMREVIEEEKNLSIQTGNKPRDIKLIFSLKKSFDIDKHRYNIPMCNEVCAVVVTDCEGNIPLAYLTIHQKILGKTKQLMNISHIDKNSQSMTFPILYPYATPGWNIDMKSMSKKNISLNEFIRFRLFQRDAGKFFPHFYAQRLFQQWLVDSYVMVESLRLQFFQKKQKKIHACKYTKLHEYLVKNASMSNVKLGRTVILPSTYTGGPRNMKENYLNAMAIVAAVGKPDLFLTMTCNPADEDIIRVLKKDYPLLKNPTAQSNPVITARIFKLKVDELLQDLLTRQIFGKVAAFTYRIEFQKRDLPHMHCLITLDKKFKPIRPDDVDAIISATIPDETSDPLLYSRVKTFMLHGPCQKQTSKGVQYGGCWDYFKGQCSKKYPKLFRERTELNDNGYPFYARPNDNKVITKFFNNMAYNFDNRHVVPYNGTLLKKYNCHINLEVVSTVKAVKYIYKYIFKGYDKTSIQMVTEDNDELLVYDEVESHINARYIGPMEASWRLLNFETHKLSHAVELLPVHLENEQTIYFDSDDDDTETDIIDKLDLDSKLMGYFKYNKKHANEFDFVAYTYKEFPTYFTWDKNKKMRCWKKRKGCRDFMGVIGRIPPVDPMQSEKFHLRLLLHHVKGAIGFEELKIELDTKIKLKSYKEKCLSLNLIKNDSEWFDCLKEASLYKFPGALRELFVNILVHSNPIYPEQLWESFKEDLTEDLNDICKEIRFKKGLLLIEKNLSDYNKSLLDYPSLPQICLDANLIEFSDECDRERELETFNFYYYNMNTKQKEVVDLVVNELNKNTDLHKWIFIDGPGGTGKTYIFNSIYAFLKSRNMSVESIAFSGVAASALQMGCTVHTEFKLPLNLTSYSNSAIELNSVDAERLKKATLILWDEIAMAPKYALEAVDRKLQEIMGNNDPFGGKRILCAGDFRQLLPVQEGATDTELIDLSVKKSSLWKNFETIKLTENMRAGIDQLDFAKWVLELGDGILNDKNDMVCLPNECQTTTDNLAEIIYGSNITNKQFSEFAKSGRVAFYNADVDELNNKVMSMLPFDEIEYTAINSSDNKEVSDFPELLDMIDCSALPLHKLLLKLNCLIMLMRNLNVKKGLVNGTRIQVTNLNKNIITGVVISGHRAGDIVFIPRITIIEDKNVPFNIHRHQFPVRLAMAMTAHKSQSQTIHRLGIDLRRDCFTFGQIYTSFSRATSFKNLFVQLATDSKGKIYNKVCKKLLVD